MKWFYIFLFCLPIGSFAQFEIQVFEVQEDNSWNEDMLDSCVSRFFTVHSEEHPDIAKKINERLFFKHLHASYKDQVSIDHLIPVSGEGGYYYCFDFEIIENSDRLLTFWVSGIDSEFGTKRYHGYTSINAATGEEIWHDDIFGYRNPNKEIFYDTVKTQINAQLMAYIETLDTNIESQKAQYTELQYCYQAWTSERGFDLNDGEIYLTTDSLYWVHPFCEDGYDVVLERKEGFTLSFDYDEAIYMFNPALVEYLRTGVWVEEKPDK